MTQDDVKAQISSMSTKDKIRLLQCVTCQNNPDNCGCDDKDEDNNGLCVRYQGHVLFVAESEDKG